MTKKALKALLKKYHINTADWKKTIDDLYRELKEGSSVLREHDGGLYREVHVAVLFCRCNGEYIAERRVYSNKEEYLLTEKFNRDESPEQACVRGLKEELGLVYFEDFEEYTNLGTHEDSKDSHSYVGISTRYHYHGFLVEMERYPDLHNADAALEFVFIDKERFTVPNCYFIEAL